MWQARSALHFGVTAAFADIVELARSKLEKQENWAGLHLDVGVRSLLRVDTH